jgi:hypothetical protein
MMHEKRKYIKPTYTKNDLNEDPRLDWKDEMENDTRQMGSAT